MKIQLITTCLYIYICCWYKGRIKIYFKIGRFTKRLVFLKNIYTLYTRGSLHKFPDFFRMGTFIDSTHMKL